MRFHLGFILITISTLYGQLDGLYILPKDLSFLEPPYIIKRKKRTLTRDDGAFRLERLTVGDQLIVSYVGFKPTSLKNNKRATSKKNQNYYPFPDQELQEVVITGTLKQASKGDSPVPVELYRSSFFSPILLLLFLRLFS